MEIIIITLLLSIYLIINIKQNLNNLTNVYNHNYDSTVLTNENKIILDKLINKYFKEEDYNDEFNQINALMDYAKKLGGKAGIIYVEHKLGIRNIG